jgi:arginyl-tRNA synthetase
METLLLQLQNMYKDVITSCFEQLTSQEIVVDVAISSQSQFGHYQFNSAMKLAKPLRKSPREIAQIISNDVNTRYPGMFDRLEIAGPGFINMWLSPSFIASSLGKVLASDRLGIADTEKNKKIVIDFSSPNTAKEMHVGHLRSTIIGDALARLFEFLGYDVSRINHIGDWGTAFGMLITYLKQYHPCVINGDEETDLTHLVAWYRESKKKFDEDPVFKKQSQEEVVSLQSGEAQSLRAWEIICDISRKAYQEVYDLLDIDITERGESFYNPRLSGVVASLEDKGIVEVSNGAKCLFMDGFENREGDPLPLIIQKSDGGYNYATTDLAAFCHRVDEEKADHLIYVTDAGQALHFKMIFTAAKKAGWLNSDELQVDHVPFGMVLRSDGKKFRTRSGETQSLVGLLNEACSRAYTILEERKENLVGEDLHAIAKAIGLGAVKYADLSSHRMSDYVFSYDKMLQFEGNTATFLMYAYVRIASIKRKITESNVSLDVNFDLESGKELDLALKNLQFADALEAMKKDLLPHRLTDYLYQLAESFNAFFRDCRVEGDPRQNIRLQLCNATARTLKLGLHLLGIQVVEKM